MSSPAKGKQVQNLLETFQQRNPEVVMAIAATTDGFSVASVSNGLHVQDEAALAVAAARILDMATEVNKQLQQGEIGRILIEGSRHTTIAVSAGTQIALIVTLPAKAKLGLAMVGIQSTAAAIAQVYQ